MVAPSAADGFGETHEVAPGILALRLPLPFRLNHVNSYLLRDGDGWAILDCGIDTAETRAIWLARLEQLGRVTRIIVSHHHPDHIGAAGFLAENTGAPLQMGTAEYRLAQEGLGLAERTGGFTPDDYRRHGLPEDRIAALDRRSFSYRRGVPSLPPLALPVAPGDRLDFDAGPFEIMGFGGHSPAQLVFNSPAADVLLAADHVLGSISPNISALSPHDNPLRLYLDSFAPLRAAVREEALVLGGHGAPFRGIGQRLDALEAHHRARCAALLQTCRSSPGLSTGDLVPKLFDFVLDEHQYWFAFREALAHLNFLKADGILVTERHDGIEGWFATGQLSD